MGRSARLFFLEGPGALVGTLVSVALTIGAVIALVDDGPFWPLLSLSLLLLVVVSFLSFHRERTRAEKRLGPTIDELVRKGISTLDFFDEKQDPDPHVRLMTPDLDDMAEAESFYYLGHATIHESAPAYLPEFHAAINAVRRKEQETLETRLRELDREKARGLRKDDLLKLKELSENAERRPRVLIEGVLHGLSAVRKSVQE